MTTIFTVITLLSDEGEVRSVILRSRESFYDRGNFGGRFDRWYMAQSDWAICDIAQYPDRHTFEHCHGW